MMHKVLGLFAAASCLLLAGCPDSGFVGAGWGENRQTDALVNAGDNSSVGDVDATIINIHQDSGATIEDSTVNDQSIKTTTGDSDDYLGIPGCSSRESFEAGFCNVPTGDGA